MLESFRPCSETVFQKRKKVMHVWKNMRVNYKI